MATRLRDDVQPARADHSFAKYQHMLNSDRDNLLMTSRRDHRMALLIDLSLNFRASHGHAAAARALAEFQVPIHIALRVLTRPGGRRRRQFMTEDGAMRVPVLMAAPP